ncbi:hypothetical protein FJZ23_01900 [Candidatus Parcubacteria bacterium]|nr:hypothetical protein [Candidatus Parcubacteria bacterium]
MPIKRVPRNTPRTLTSEQKVAFALLVFLALGGVYFGFRSFGANIRRPFDLQIAKYLRGEKFTTSSQREAAELEASKTRDTDGDGLTDYDELYVYKTSPYLADSDSDGFDDKTEIFSNNDPNCPKDTVCGSEAETVPSQNAVPELVQALGQASALLSAGEFDFDSPEDVAAFFKQATIEEIRNALLQTGMSQEELDQISDEDLERFFNTTLDEAAKQGAFDSVIDKQE